MKVIVWAQSKEVAGLEKKICMSNAHWALSKRGQIVYLEFFASSSVPNSTSQRGQSMREELEEQERWEEEIRIEWEE